MPIEGHSFCPPLISVFNCFILDLARFRDHLTAADIHAPNLYATTRAWLFGHFLHWVEVMSLLDAVDDIVGILVAARTLFEVCGLCSAGFFAYSFTELLNVCQ